MNEIEQLEALYPQTKQVTLTSVTGDVGPLIIEVSAIRMGRLAPFMRAINGILPAFAGEGELDLAALVIMHADAVIDGLAVAVDVERRLIESLDLADVILLLGAVVEVNADFFTHRLRPAIEQASTKIVALAGQKSFNA